MKPFLKWVGGKTQIIDNVMATFPDHIQNYHEPFLGGGSVLFALLDKHQKGTITISGNICAYDINPALIHVYMNVQSTQQYPLLREQLAHLQIEFNNRPVGLKRVRQTKTTPVTEADADANASREQYYYWLRQNYNSMTDEERCSPRGSALFIFMNKAGFRGVYREGPRGFNVPYGNPKQIHFDLEHLDEAHRILSPVQFRCCSFIDMRDCVKNGDFVYMDPPYVPETATSFVNYHLAGFDMDMHRVLFEWVRELAEKRTQVVMSNFDAPLVRDFFSTDAYTIHSIICRRAIHSKNPATRANEVLVCT